MAYTPPAGGAVDFDFTDTYTPIKGDSIEFRLGDSGTVCQFFVSSRGDLLIFDFTGAYTPAAGGSLDIQFNDVCYPDPNAGSPPEPSPQEFSPHTRAKFLGKNPKQRHNATRWVDSAFISRHVTTKRDQLTKQEPSIRADWGILEVLNDTRRGPSGRHSLFTATSRTGQAGANSASSAKAAGRYGANWTAWTPRRIYPIPTHRPRIAIPGKYTTIQWGRSIAVFQSCTTTRPSRKNTL